MNKVKFADIINNKIVPRLFKIGELKAVNAVRDGFAMTLPVIMVGSLFLILTNIPVLLGFGDAIAGVLGENWASNLGLAVNATFGLMGLITAATVTYCYAKEHKMDGIAPAVTNIAAFLLTIPLNEGQMPLSSLGSLGLFVAIILSFLTVHIFKFAKDKNLTIKLPDSVPPSVANSFSAMFPTVITISLVLALRLSIEAAGLESIQVIIRDVLATPLQQATGNYWGGLLYVLIIHLLWSVGIHGANVANSVMSPILLAQLDQNRMAFEAGLPLPNVITDTFFVFVWIGGSGVLLALTLVILLKAKSAQNKQIGRLGIAPTIFSINEPVMFGLPVIFNPIILIPYVLSVVVVFSISFFALYTGLVPRTNGVLVHWTTPIFVSGFLVTGSIRGVILQLVNLVVAGLIYLPFFMKYDQKIFAAEIQDAKEYKDETLSEYLVNQETESV